MLRTRGMLYVAVLLIAGTALMACQSAGRGATPTPDLSATAEENVISVSGKIVPIRWANLGFGASGIVQEVRVAEGQPVQAGAILATLDTPELEAAVAQAEAGVKAAQARVAQLQAAPRPVDLRSAEVTVLLAQDGVQTAQTSVKVAQSNTQAAQAALEVAQASLKRAKAGPTADELELARRNIEQAKNLLYASQGQRDAIGGAKKGLGYQSGSYEAAQGQVYANESAVQIAELNLRILSAGPRNEDIQIAAAQVRQAQAALDAAKAQEASVQQQTVVSQHQVEQAQAQLDLLKAPARPEDIAAAEAAVAQAEAALQSAQAALERASLRAPFDGTITEVNLRVGEYVLMGTPSMSLGDLSALRVETTDLDELDVARVAEGRKVILTFDALPEVQLPGTVQSIALKAGAGSGGTTYKATIALDERDPRLRWGMTAFVDIETE